MHWPKFWHHNQYERLQAFVHYWHFISTCTRTTHQVTSTDDFSFLRKSLSARLHSLSYMIAWEYQSTPGIREEMRAQGYGVKGILVTVSWWLAEYVFTLALHNDNFVGDYPFFPPRMCIYMGEHPRLIPRIRRVFSNPCDCDGDGCLFLQTSVCGTESKF